MATLGWVASVCVHGKKNLFFPSFTVTRIRTPACAAVRNKQRKTGLPAVTMVEYCMVRRREPVRSR